MPIKFRPICDNPEISKLDDDLAASYKAALQGQRQVEAIKQAQRQWIRERNGCADIGCVRRAYEKQLSVFRDADNSAQVKVCEVPESSSVPNATIYKLKHQIWEHANGKTNVTDDLSIWDRHDNSMCFFIEAIDNNAHLCWLQGQAVRVRDNKYQYTDTECVVNFELLDGQMKVRVKDATQIKNDDSHFCKPADNERWVCGANGTIKSGTYKFQEKR